MFVSGVVIVPFCLYRQKGFLRMMMILYTALSSYQILPNPCHAWRKILLYAAYRRFKMKSGSFRGALMQLRAKGESSLTAFSCGFL